MDGVEGYDVDNHDLSCCEGSTTMNGVRYLLESISLFQCAFGDSNEPVIR